MEIESLETESLENVYGAFMEAFSDYSVPVTWSIEEFRASCGIGPGVGQYEMVRKF